MKAILMAAILLALSACATVENYKQNPLSEPTQVAGGSMRETQADVIAIGKFNLNGVESPNVVCKGIVGQPVVRWRAIATIDVGDHTIALVELHFADKMVYGVWGAPVRKKGT